MENELFGASAETGGEMALGASLRQPIVGGFGCWEEMGAVGGVSTPIAGLSGQPSARPARISSTSAADTSPEFSKERRVMEFLDVVRVPQTRLFNRAFTGLQAEPIR
jgi:hypothetical protein